MPHILSLTNVRAFSDIIEQRKGIDSRGVIDVKTSKKLYSRLEYRRLVNALYFTLFKVKYDIELCRMKMYFPFCKKNYSYSSPYFPDLTVMLCCCYAFLQLKIFAHFSIFHSTLVTEIYISRRIKRIFNFLFFCVEKEQRVRNKFCALLPESR